MHRSVLILALAIACGGCGLLPIEEGIASLLPTADLSVAATPAFPAWGTIDAGALTMQTTIAGTVLDQYGSGMSGVVICFGPDEDRAVAIGATDSAGAYSGVAPESFEAAGGNRVWAYLPLYRFEPDRVEIGILFGENTLDFTAYPSVYPVPPERDCR